MKQTILLVGLSLLLMYNHTRAQALNGNNLNTEQQKYLEWALTGKGEKPSIESVPQAEIKRGVYDPEFIGSPLTEFAYTKGWFAPYNEWTQELQKNVHEESQVLQKDFRVEVFQDASTWSWNQKGPYGMRVLGSSPTVYFSGRVTSIDFNSETGLHLTTGTGGLWGKPWFIVLLPLADKVASLTAGSVAVHPTNPDTIYFGTGEYNRRSGTGVYRTTDGGTTWTQLALTPTPTGTKKIFIASWNPSLVIIATDAGIFRSTDNGDTWTRVATWSASDFSSSPLGTVMLAGRMNNGVYRSTDYGVTWNKLTSGLPSSNVGRISLVIAPSNYVRAYVQIARYDNDAILGVYRTDNDNDPTPSWTNVTPTGDLAGYMPNQGWIHNAIGVNPTNSGIVWVGGVRLLRSGNAGSNWEERGTNTGQVHGDIHVIYYRKSDNLLYIGCDGGLFTSDDDGANWSSFVNQVLPVTQFYNIHVARYDDRIKYGGSQDNGISGTSTSGPDDWIHSCGGDGVDDAVDWSNIERIYATNGIYEPPSWRRVLTTNSGTNWNFINSGVSESTPWASIYIQQDHVFSNYLYSNAGNYFYYTSNSASSWQRMNTSALSGNAKHVCVNSVGTFVYGCTDNLTQRLMGYTYSSGSTPPWTQSNISAGLPNKDVKRVSASMTNGSRAYAIMTGVGDNQKIYRTTNKGSNWDNITSNLPNSLPVNDLIENPNNSNILYLATHAGAYKSTNGGTSWYRWNNGLPEAVWILDMEYVFDSEGDYLVAGTFGRSTFERRATGVDAVFALASAVLHFGSITNEFKTESLYVKNRGDKDLNISYVSSNSPYFEVWPQNGIIQPAESLKFFVRFNNRQLPPGKIGGEIEFTYDGDGSPTFLGLSVYVGDGTEFRSFVPDSLLVKKEVKRKTKETLWCFNFPNTAQSGDPAVSLEVVFKNPVISIDSYEPFNEITKLDEKGKTWKFSNGSVPYGSSLILCGKTKRKSQEVVRWSWTILNEMRDPLVDEHGTMLPSSQGGVLPMPNTANVRMEVFENVPFNKLSPMIIGVADPNFKLNRVAYVAFAKHGDLIGSLMPGRSGKKHDGPPRFFNYFDNSKEMVGKIKKLTPDKQSNRLFAELIALKLNINASKATITPIGFGELKYIDASSRFNGLMIKEIDALADVYMTYGDSSTIGSAIELDSVVRKINSAFVGPMDTISFASKLELTGVKPIAEVTFLERDPAIIPEQISPRSITSMVPLTFTLYQNYPNPFNPNTTIEFFLPEPSIVTLKIYNILGQEVATLLNLQQYDEGDHEVDYTVSNLSSGVYFYRLVAEKVIDDDFDEDSQDRYIGNTHIAIKKMLIVR